MSSPLIQLLLLLLLLPLYEAGIHCSIHGDTHVLMSDGATKYQHHSAGLFRAFATAMNTKRMEVQCEFTDRTTVQSNVVDPQMSSCRVKVVDTTVGCGIDIRHGGIEQPGIGSIMGRDMPLSAMSQVALNPALGVNLIPLTNNALSVEVNWNGTLVQVIMGERLLQIHSSMVQQCQGLCGSCSGSQQFNGMDPNTVAAFIAQYTVQPSAAIQPDQGCSAPASGRLLSGSSPQLFLQTSAQPQQYPVPAYRPPSINDALYQAQFESQQVLMQVFQQCSNNDQQRLQVDPWFNSFVEDCIYDKSLGPGFESSAKASMDAYVTWTESLLRWARIGQALRQAPLMQICAACIPVTWTDPVQSILILTPAVTQRRGSLNFPLRYSSSASQYLVPGRFVQSYVGSDFLNSAWNSPITLSPLSQLNLLPLPQQLISSPIVVGPNSNDISGMQMSFNPLPAASSGTCSLFDQQSMSTYNQMASQFVSNGQLSQLLQLIQQGRYPYLACALTCMTGMMSSSFSSMTSLASSILLSDAAALCPSQQYLNGFGNPMLNNILQSSMLNSFNGLNGLNPNTNSLSMLNGLSNLGLNSLGALSAINGANGLNLPNGITGVNGLNALNGFSGFNGVNGANVLNGVNGVNAFNGFNDVNGINGPANFINGVNGINGLNGINNGVPANQLLNNMNIPSNQQLNGLNLPANQLLNGLNGINGLPSMNTLAGLNSINPMNGFNGFQSVNPLTGINGINAINPILNNNLNALNNRNSQTAANQVLSPNQVVNSFMF